MKKMFFIIFVTVLIIPYQLFSQGIIAYRQEGIASWYGREFDGRPTASGEVFDSSQLTAAHPNLPFGTILVVTNLHNNKNVTVRVNDRGPFVSARIIDVSRAAAEQLDMITTGTAPVTIEMTGINSSVVGTQMSSHFSTTQVAPIFPHQPSVTSVVVPSPAAQPPVIQSPVVPIVEAPVAQPSVRLIPSISVDLNKSYRLQIGSFRVARNAVDAFDRLKNAGLNPVYERYDESDFYRVALIGVSGIEMPDILEKINAAGFREVLIREEN